VEAIGGFRGEVVALHVAGAAGAPMEERDVVDALAGEGLAGDRYSLGAGTYSDRPGVHRQVTLLEQEEVDAVARDFGIALDLAQTRRNVTTRGVPLAHLVGREFRVGAATLRGVKICEPCGYLQDLLDVRGLVAAFSHRMGLNAEILVSGPIAVGDPVVAQP
jgi:MOSC domain-containing protein YiiM